MHDILVIALLFGASFLTAAALISTFHFLPKKNFQHHSIKLMIRYTQNMRTGNRWQKMAFWGFPICVVVFFNVLIGMLMLTGTSLAMVFSKRYNAYLTNLPSINAAGSS